jgi:hypothetical protein
MGRPWGFYVGAESMTAVLSNDRQSLPPCFGRPDRCSACASCGVRPECYEQQSQRPLFLLPADRVVRRKRGR